MSSQFNHPQSESGEQKHDHKLFMPISMDERMKVSAASKASDNY